MVRNDCIDANKRLAAIMHGAGDGNRTRMTSLEGCARCAVRGRDLRSGRGARC